MKGAPRGSALHDLTPSKPLELQTMFRLNERTDVVQIDAGRRETLKKSSADLARGFVNNFLEIQLAFRVEGT
jgi:hypothetical protein